MHKLPQLQIFPELTLFNLPLGEPLEAQVGMKSGG